MSDPTLSDIDFKNKAAWVWTTLKNVNLPYLWNIQNIKVEIDKYQAERKMSVGYALSPSRHAQNFVENLPFLCIEHRLVDFSCLWLFLNQRPAKLKSSYIDNNDMKK